MKLTEIFSFENLYHAHTKCRNSKQQKGEVIRFEANLSSNLTKIMKEITERNFRLGKYKKFIIYEPKERIIEAPPYKDRVIIRCFCDNCLKPKLEHKLIYDNVACRKEKGTTFAINRLHSFLRSIYLKQKNNQFYFLKCDIKKYFPSINHDILLKILFDCDFSEEEMWFIEKLVKEQLDTNIGLPLGNQSSQWFALLYLNSLDHYIKEKLRVKCYIRYMDDMILIHSDKKFLQYCKQEIEEYCKDNLKLLLNQKTQIGKVENGIDFLGYRHIITKSGKIIKKLRVSSRIRMKKHIQTMKKLKQKGKVDEEYIYIRKNAFYNHIKDTKESIHLKKEVFPKKE